MDGCAGCVADCFELWVWSGHTALLCSVDAYGTHEAANDEWDAEPGLVFEEPIAMQ